MKISTEELNELLTNANSGAKELMALRERVLKLEHKINELYDMLTDFRVNQVMNAKDSVTNTPDLCNVTVKYPGESAGNHGKTL